jgi:L-alanine-DL-glutamate epimerase-like enolase superfamily enzyme
MDIWAIVRSIAEGVRQYGDRLEWKAWEGCSSMVVPRATARNIDPPRLRHLFLQVIDPSSGREGWGEAVARSHNTGETLEQQVTGLFAWSRGATPSVGPGLRWAIASALFDLFKPVPPPDTDGTSLDASDLHGWFGLEDANGFRQAVHRAHSQGLNAGIKVKLDADHKRTALLVEKVRAHATAFGWRRVIFDANGSLDLSDSFRLIDSLELFERVDLDVYLEQPVLAESDLVALANAIGIKCKIRIIADESLVDPVAARRLVRCGCYLNIKPHHHGLVRAVACVAAAESSNRGWFLGSTIGTPMLGLMTKRLLSWLPKPLFLDASPSSLFLGADCPVQPLNAELHPRESKLQQRLDLMSQLPDVGKLPQFPDVIFDDVQ